MHLLGVIAHQVGRHDIAVELIGQAIEISPTAVSYHANLAAALRKLGREADALAAYETVLRIAPDHADALRNRANLLHNAGRLGEALAAYDAALRVKADDAQVLANRGILLHGFGRADEALPSYDAALRLKPDYADALSNRGAALDALGRGEEALASYDAALRLEPGHAEAHCNRGSALYGLGRLDEARASFEAALHLKPDYADAGSQLIHCLQSACSWDGLEQHQRRIAGGAGKIAQFPLLTFDIPADRRLAAAKRYAAALGEPAVSLARRPFRKDGKIRLGYLSPDFRQHPTSHLIAGLIEQHDRRRFEVIGYSYGPDDDSPMRQRMMKAFDRFVDIRASSHTEAARTIHADGVDILIDLAGYTRHARTQILACRPAPAQVNFLGYPGTMGADFIDYIIADEICIPSGDEHFFSETVIRLPNCYQPNDSRREIAPEAPERPGQGFVFCCFNNSFKITPAIFAVWMRLLAKVPDSVLWLLDGNGNENLRREAKKAGIDPERLIIAQRLSPPDHLARHRQADLFLDTLPYNAHTTASDALWAGLPVLTCRGDSFAGRVAASLLTAVGVPELITSSLAEYEALALALAADPARLASLRQKLAASRDTAPLFDTACFARNLEEAYRRIAQ